MEQLGRRSALPDGDFSTSGLHEAAGKPRMAGHQLHVLPEKGLRGRRRLLRRRAVKGHAAH